MRQHPGQPTEVRTHVPPAFSPPTSVSLPPLRPLHNTTPLTLLSSLPSLPSSPINFQTFGKIRDMVTIKKEEGAMTFSGHKCDAKIEFKEGTWEVVVPADCGFKMTVGGAEYKLLQFHFHNAEHTVNYAYMPLEVHMVHQKVDDEDDILVLGTFLSPGAASQFFDSLETDQQNADAEHPDLDTKHKINAFDILSKDLAYWHYQGSLTTPPCQKKVGAHVKWYVSSLPPSLHPSFFSPSLPSSYDHIYAFTNISLFLPPSLPSLFRYVFKTPNTLSYNQLYFFTSYFRDLPLSDNGRVSRDMQDVLESTTLQSFP